MRIGELLAHTAGLAADAAGPWWERTPGDLRPELSDVLGDDPIRHPAGRRFHYSNVGFAVLGALVAQLRGKPWHEVIRDEILAPLGMSRTAVTPTVPFAAGWAVHPWADLLLPEPAYDAGLMAPAGQFWSTADDLRRFAAFLGSGASDVLSSDSLAEMREPAAPSSPRRTRRQLRARPPVAVLGRPPAVRALRFSARVHFGALGMRRRRRRSCPGQRDF